MFSTSRTKVVALVAVSLMASSTLRAQIGDHRNDLSIGFNGGYVFSSVGFTPKVTQDSHPGITFGLSMRYTCEKYFNTICSISAELNYARIGWKESILTANDQPVINVATGLAEAYQRDIAVWLYAQGIYQDQLQLCRPQHHRPLQSDMRTGHNVCGEQV